MIYDKCFKWTITRALKPVGKNSESTHINLREKSKFINWEGLKFSVNLIDINKFENDNSSVSINVLR